MARPMDMMYHYKMTPSELNTLVAKTYDSMKMTMRGPAHFRVFNANATEVRQWIDTDNQTNLTVHEAAEKLAEYYLSWLSVNLHSPVIQELCDHTYSLMYTKNDSSLPDSTIRTAATGPTPLHALVKAVEAVQAAKPPDIQSDEIKTNDPPKATVEQDEGDSSTFSRWTSSITSGETTFEFWHYKNRKIVWLNTRENDSGRFSRGLLDSTSLYELRKVIDECIRRTGGAI